MATKIVQILWEGRYWPMQVTRLYAPAAGAPVPSDKWLRDVPAREYQRMAAAAWSVGVPFVVNTAHRDSAYQQRLYDAYLAARERGENPSPVARPGTSDHERGIALDIDTQGRGRDSITYKWMAAHAAEYGFANTVSSEPWHWSYSRPLEASDDDGWTFGTWLKFGTVVGLGYYWWRRRGKRR